MKHVNAGIVIVCVFSGMAFYPMAQSASALQFYDSTGTSPTARLGWSDADGGAFFLQAPAETEAIRINDGGMLVPGTVQAAAFAGDGSRLSNVLQPNGIGSEHIKAGAIGNDEISAQAGIDGRKIIPRFGDADIHTNGKLILSDASGGGSYYLVADSSFANNALVTNLMFKVLDEISFRLYFQNATSTPGIPRHSAHFSGWLSSRTLMADTVDATTYLVNGAPGTLSDSLLKQDIHPIDNALETICRLQGVSYRFRRHAYPQLQLPDGPQLGLVAQQVEAMVPQAVSSDRSGYLHIEYHKLVPILVNAVKEQRETSERQHAEVQRLREEVHLLRQLLAQ